MVIAYKVIAVVGVKVEPREGVIVNSVVIDRGVGFELEKLIKKLHLKPAAGCKCASRIQRMNTEGVDWCSNNIDTIVGWLEEEADRAKLPFNRTVAKLLIRRAISNTKTNKEDKMTIKLIVKIDEVDVYKALERTRPKEGTVTAATIEPDRTEPQPQPPTRRP